MYINNLTSTPSLKSVTVTLSYDEVRDIANGLYYLNKYAKETSLDDIKDDQYTQIGAKAAFLFDMVKHGMIQPETIEKFNKAHNVNTDEKPSETNDDTDGLPKYHGQV